MTEQRASVKERHLAKRRNPARYLSGPLFLAAAVMLGAGIWIEGWTLLVLGVGSLIISAGLAAVVSISHHRRQEGRHDIRCG